MNLDELREENERLRVALIAHRADLHNWSRRPCPTCRRSADALGIRKHVPDECARMEHDRAALRLPVVVEVRASEGVMSLPTELAERRRLFITKIERELDRAYAKHGGQRWGRHEFYGVLLEEVDELWDSIKADESLDRVEEEMVQVAAMCFRYFETRDRCRAEAERHS